MEFLFFIFPCLLVFGVHGLVVRPFLSGELEIDKNLFPTLARAQRVLRSLNTKAREKELIKAVTRLRSDTDHEIYNSQKIALGTLNEDRKKHKDSLNEWDSQFKALTLREELAEQGRLRAEMELKEAARLKEFLEQQKNQAKLANETMYDTWRRNEALYNSKVMEWATNKDHTVKYDTRLIDPNMRVNVRSQPTSESRLWGTLLPSTTVEVTGWISGERLRGNSIWFKVITPDSSEAYIWSGALTDQSTSGLTDLNSLEHQKSGGYECRCEECHEYETIYSFDGSVVQRVARKRADYWNKHSMRKELEALNKQVEALPKKLNLSNAGFDHEASSMFEVMKAPNSTQWSLYD